MSRLSIVPFLITLRPPFDPRPRSEAARSNSHAVFEQRGLEYCSCLLMGRECKMKIVLRSVGGQIPP